MPVGAQAGGTTWNESGDVTTRFPELTTSSPEVISATTLAQIVAEAQAAIEAKLRPHWDVDDSTYWSSANIETYAPLVGLIHLLWSGGLAYLAVTGKEAIGTADTAQIGVALLETAQQMLTDLIENGALAVARRSAPYEGGGAYTTAGDSDPVFTEEDETNWPRATSSGTRDDDPWP